MLLDIGRLAGLRRGSLRRMLIGCLSIAGQSGYSAYRNRGKDMRKVILLTGFNNWGKTTLIQAIFNRTRFHQNQVYRFAGHDFCVQPLSNDDIGKKRYEDSMKYRLRELSKKGIKTTHIISAFCPTKDNKNDSASIIR